MTVDQNKNARLKANFYKEYEKLEGNYCKVKTETQVFGHWVPDLSSKWSKYTSYSVHDRDSNSIQIVRAAYGHLLIR
jgi:hypothetical protein